jgi:hypothetical protein
MPLTDLSPKLARYWYIGIPKIKCSTSAALISLAWPAWEARKALGDRLPSNREIARTLADTSQMPHELPTSGSRDMPQVFSDRAII